MNTLPEDVLHSFEHDTEVVIPHGVAPATWEKALLACHHLHFGRTLSDVCARIGVSRPTLLAWRKSAWWSEAQRMVDRVELHQMKGLAHNALREILTKPNVDNKTRLAAARFVLERTDTNYIDPKLKLGFDDTTQESTLSDLDGLEPDELRALLRMARSGVPISDLAAQARNTITINPLETLDEAATERDEEIHMQDIERVRKRALVQAELIAEETDALIASLPRHDVPPLDEYDEF